MSYTYLIKMIAYDSSKLNVGVSILNTLPSSGNIHVSQIPLPVRKKVYTVLRSPHIDKKSREQFERRQYTRLLKITSPSAEVFSEVIDQLKTKMLPGISLQIKFYTHETL